MHGLQIDFFTNKNIVRRLQILNELERHSYCTGTYLGNITESTRRTILRGINEIRDYFEESIQIESTRNGYSLSILSPRIFLERKQTLAKNEPVILILESIFFGKLQSITDWEEQLFISATTLSKYIKRAKPFLEEYGLSFAGPLVQLKGTEINIRNFFSNFFYVNKSDFMFFLKKIKQSQDINLTKFEQLTSKFSLVSNGDPYLLLINWIRALQGHKIVLPSSLKADIKGDPDFLHLSSVTKELFSEDEQVHLYIQLLCRRGKNTLQEEIRFCQLYTSYPEMKQLATEASTSLLKNSITQEIDQVFLESFFITAKIKTTLSREMSVVPSSVVSFVQTRFPEEYQQFSTFLQANKLFSKNFYEDQVLDFSIDCVLYVESLKEAYWGVPQKIAIVFEGNEYITQYMDNWSRKYLGAFHQVYYPKGGELKVDYMKSNKINIFITNNEAYYLAFVEEVASFLFHATPSGDDWNRVFNHINPQITKYYRLENNL